MSQCSPWGKSEQPVIHGADPQLSPAVLIHPPNFRNGFRQRCAGDNLIAIEPQQGLAAKDQEVSIPCLVGRNKTVGYGLGQGRSNPALATPKSEKMILRSPNPAVVVNLTEVSVAFLSRRFW